MPRVLQLVPELISVPRETGEWSGFFPHGTETYTLFGQDFKSIKSLFLKENNFQKLVRKPSLLLRLPAQSGQ